jgi:hypothetical protein
MQMMEDGVDQQTQDYEALVSGLLKHIFGPGEDGVKKQLRQASDIPEEVGRMSFLMIDAASQQAKDAHVEIDIDMLMAAASEIIDALLQVAEAMGKIETADDDDMREDAMMTAIHTYLTVGNPTPEDAEAAQQALAQFGDEDMAVAEDTLTRMGARRGEDPFAEEAPVDAGGGVVQPPPDAPPRGLMQAG